jgi:polyhydroxyalkanoate synthesis regulator phasin
VKILEGHFMTLFKSPEYNQTLADLFIKVTDFIVAKNEMFQDILQILPVPTYKEIDELYRDLHILKKRVRELEGQLNPA